MGRRQKLSDRGTVVQMAPPPTKHKTIANLVLYALEKSVDGYVRFENFTYHHYRYKYGYPELKKASLAKALKRLREGGFIELISDEELIFRLTDKGKDRALWEKVKNSNRKWDGKWRIVVWDVPEKRRQARDLLRYKLKQLGFTQWQKSIWATKVDCAKALRDFIRKVGIEDWVMVIESNNIGR